MTSQNKGIFFKEFCHFSMEFYIFKYITSTSTEMKITAYLIPTQLFQSFYNFFILFFARFGVKCKLTMKFLSNLKKVNI